MILSTKPIYFDYMATTPIDPYVIERMLPYMGPDGDFGNPASLQHSYGQIAAHAVATARMQIADAIGSSPDSIIFTSGATESNNLAIFGAARFYQRKGKHVITMTTEHKSVLDCFRQLEREGFEVTYLPPESNGLLKLENLAEALRTDTILVSIMHVNNEIGVIQDIAEIGQLLHKKGIIFHVDAAQSAGKLLIDVQQLPVDLMSLSAHKNYGPKGIGALYIRQKPRIRLQPLLWGGGQEQGLRSGTLPTHQIVGMGEAFAHAHVLLEEEQARILSLRQQLWHGIHALPGIHLNGHETQRLAGNLNFSVAGIDSADLIPALPELAVSTLSACSAASHESSYVLREIGLSASLAKSSIRLSLGRFTTKQEVQRAIEAISRALLAFHKDSPQ